MNKKKLYESIGAYKQRRADRLDSREHMDYGVKGMKWGQKKGTVGGTAKSLTGQSSFSGASQKTKQNFISALSSIKNPTAVKAIEKEIGMSSKFMEDFKQVGKLTDYDAQCIAYSAISHAADALQDKYDRTKDSVYKEAAQSALGVMKKFADTCDRSPEEMSLNIFPHI